MSKALSTGQALELVSRFSIDTDWGSLDGDIVQRRIISLSREELGRRFTAFLKNGANLIVGEPKIILIDRSKPFDPSKFLGKGWTIWRGPADGNGLEGEEEQDARSLAITELDLSKVRLVTTFKKGETAVKGEENLCRLREASYICLDAGIFQTFWNQQEPIPRLLKELTNGGYTYVFFKGTILRNPSGRRYVLYLLLVGGGWRWSCSWLDCDWNDVDPSAVLAS